MKALVLNEGDVVVRVFEDSDSVLLLDEATQVGNPGDEVHYFIGFCNASNATLYENVQSPADYSPQAYLFDGANWTPRTTFSTQPE